MSIDKDAFLFYLGFSPLVLDRPDDINHLLALHISTMRDLVEEHSHIRLNDPDNE